MKKEKMSLVHFALFCKQHYAWPKENKEHDENMWESVRKALNADDYQPQTKEDIISILISNVTKHIKKEKEDFTMLLIDSIHPHRCHSVGYYTRDFQFAKGHTKRVKYHYQTAVLYFFIHHTKFMHKDEFDGLPKADPRVMSLHKNYTK